jgi:hypothetical protein
MNETFVIAAISWLASLLLLSWSLGRKYGELKNGIEKNQKDINDAYNSLRAYVRTRDYLLEAQIRHIQNHLTKREDYDPPTLNDFDREQG